MPKTASLPALLASLLLILALQAPAASATPESFVEDKKAGAATTMAPSATASPAASPAPRRKASAPAAMDTSVVHNSYLEGEFEQAIKALEAQLKSKRPMAHSESLFVFKHLGVMYAASPATREKGKHYMHELIRIEPTAKILDMYASDMIHLIFRNVQEEWETTRPPAKAAPQVAEPPVAADPPAQEVTTAVPPPHVAQARPESKDRKALYMAAAGAGVAAAALGLYLFLSEPEPNTKVVTVNE